MDPNQQPQSFSPQGQSHPNAQPAPPQMSRFSASPQPEQPPVQPTANLHEPIQPAVTPASATQPPPIVQAQPQQAPSTAEQPTSSQQPPPTDLQSPEIIADEEGDEEIEPETTLLTWAAPEFIATAKPAGWYMLIYGFFGILIIIAIIFKQWFSIALSIVMAVSITIFSNRKPKNQVYAITNFGVQIGDKKLDFDHFKAFFISDDYGQKVFDLVPNKRFEPLVSMPVSAEILEPAEQLISQILPKTEPHEDIVDKAFKFLRF